MKDVSSLSDSILIEELQKKYSEEIFKELYFRYEYEVLLLLRSLNTYISDIELNDVLQEVFIVVYKKIKSLRNPKKLKSWMFQIAKRKLYDFTKKKKRHHLFPISREKYENISDDNNIIEKYIRNDWKNKAYSHILDFYQILNDEDKILFFLRIVKEDTFKDISVFMSWSLRKTKYKFKDLKNKLTAFLKDREFEL